MCSILWLICFLFQTLYNFLCSRFENWINDISETKKRWWWESMKPNPNSDKPFFIVSNTCLFILYLRLRSLLSNEMKSFRYCCGDMACFTRHTHYPNLVIQGCRKVWKSDRAGKNGVGIISPLPPRIYQNLGADGNPSHPHCPLVPTALSMYVLHT